MKHIRVLKNMHLLQETMFMPATITMCL